ncbi:hypothetical protein NBRC116583_02550 [Arenicella sp. 4NH20-0111]|uniref:B12-binding domain-containing radical SAM protein n=1 Tax=Arenicella sp. 4NH20-0111 TaxID=3127648 RepID=UPI0031037679
MSHLVAISSGMLSPKKGDQPFYRAHRYLNYGLLSLASRIPSIVQVLHGNFTPPNLFLNKNPSILEANVILLSIPSFYGVPWASELVKEIIARKKSIEIHIGGRWVIDQNWNFIKLQFPSSVYIHRGIGEKVIDSLVNRWRKNGTLSHNQNRSATPLNYALLSELETFHPSVEVSRGCGLGCAFCEEANEPLSRLIRPANLLTQISEISESYIGKKNFYFESSMFAPSIEWANQLLNLYLARDETFLWRTETRADVISREKLAILAQAGLKVLDIGLESASPEQLLNMKKTSKPEAYIRKASEMLHACKDLGIKAKVNILLYPGETYSTLQETRQFLSDHSDAIFGVSTYPVVAYGTGDRIKYFDNLYRSQGSTGIHKTNIEGVWDVGLSPELGAIESKLEARNIAREFMSKENYYYLKKFSYLDPAYSWETFSNDVRHIKHEDRPFGY